jgi:hypothetical protein
MIKKENELNWQEINDRFYYFDGNLYYKNNFHKMKANDVAGSISTNGSIQVKINGKLFELHRVIWFLFNKSWPKNVLDHIDRNNQNNKLENLREATLNQNQGNKDLRSDNKTGLIGVTYHKASKKFRAQIGINNKFKHLGVYNTKEAAAEAYNKAALNYFGEFARLNIL